MKQRPGNTQTNYITNNYLTNKLLYLCATAEIKEGNFHNSPAQVE
jgi:hypothetical protein